MPDCAEKLLYYKNKISSGILLEVDGGIDEATSKIATEKGANVLVAGTYIYKAENIERAIFELKSCGN